MKAQCQELEEEIRRLEAEIEEQRLRIPPHSMQPAMLIELEELEARLKERKAELLRLLSS